MIVDVRMEGSANTTTPCCVTLANIDDMLTSIGMANATVGFVLSEEAKECYNNPQTR